MQTKKTRWGVRQYAMVNSGNHLMSIFPLDGPLSISGRNNLGKTQALQSMQFLFFSNLQHMNFGSNDTRASRDYFFPSDSSFILMEVMLPNGIFIVGAHGKGSAGGNEYQLFIAKTELSLDDFTEDNRILNYKSVFRNWMDRGVEMNLLTREEMRQILYGEYIRVNNGKWDVTLMPLANSSERRYNVFRQLYRNLLTQQELKSKELKELILDVFSDKLSNAQINFTEVRQQAFRQYNMTTSEIRTLDLREEDILAYCREADSQRAYLEEGSFLKKELSINVSIAAKQFPEKIQKLTELREKEVLRKTEIEASHKAKQEEAKKLSAEKGQYDFVKKEINKLIKKTELSDRPTTQASYDAISSDYSKTVELINHAKAYNVKTIKSKIESTRKSVDQLTKRIKAIESSEPGLIESLGFSAEEKQSLSRMMNSGVFDLPLTALTRGKQSELAQYLNDHMLSIDGLFEANGFALDLTSIAPLPFEQVNIEELREHLVMDQATLEEMELQLDAAMDQEKYKNKLADLTVELEKYKGYLHDFDMLDEYRKRHEEAGPAIKELEESIRLISAEIEDFVPQLEQINNDLLQIDVDLTMTRGRHEELKNIQKSKQLQNSRFPDHPAPDESFERDLNEYEFATTKTRLEWLGNALDAIRNSMKAYGERILQDIPSLSEHQTPEDIAKKAMEMLEARPQMQEMSKRQHEEAIVRVAGALKDLSENYGTLRNQINLFNRHINQRKISNIRRFTVDLVRNDPIMDSIDVLLDHMTQVDPTNADLFAISTPERSATEISRAMDRLTRIITDEYAGSLEVSDLFGLSFATVDVHGKETVCEKLDQLASNGSTMTLKPLLYMSLIRYMMDRNCKTEAFLPFYLDEVSCVDESNQKAILSYCEDMSFIPVFASVDPTTTVKWGVNLSECVTEDDKIFITQKDWQQFIPFASESASEEEQVELL